MKNKIIGVLIAVAIFAISGCISTFDRLKLESVDGNIESQAALGMAFVNGGIDRIDYREAAKWLGKASKSGNPCAHYFYAYLIENGLFGTIPDHEKARKLYENAFSILSKSETSKNMTHSYVLGLLYLNGRGTNKNETKALELFTLSSDNHYLPAAIELGKMYNQGIGIKQNIEQAKRYFFRAADRGYPEAQYYLSLIERSERNHSSANRLLTRAAERGYPPAIYDMAEQLEKKNGQLDDKSRELYLDAANRDYSKAQFKMYQILSEESNVAEEWLTKAVERSYPPAMAVFASVLNQKADPAKALILYNLINKTGNPAIAPHIELLDSKTGLYLPVKFLWNEQRYGSDFIFDKTGTKRIIDGYHAGIIDGSMTAFQNNLKEDSNNIYMTMDWFLMFENKMPLNWISMIFKEVSRQKQDTPGFWLNYGICAIQAGQAEVVMYSAAKMEGIDVQSLNQADVTLYRELTIIMKTAGLIMLESDEEAYNFIYLNGQLAHSTNPYLINCINFWFRPVLKDKSKFSLATGIKEKTLLNYQTYPRARFFDLEYEKELIERTTVQEPRVNLQPIGVL